MDINEKFDPDRLYYAVVWRHAPWWLIEIQPVGVTQTFWWADVDYMARDMVDCMFDLDDPSAHSSGSPTATAPGSTTRRSGPP